MFSLATIVSYRYVLLGPLAFVEGPLLAVLCGAAAAYGYIDPFIAYGILVLGDLAPDLMYYGLGRWGANLRFVQRFRKKLFVLRDNLPAVEEMWRRHTLPSMASAKLAYGLSAPFIVSAGLARMPLRRFALSSLAVSIPYLAALMALGWGVAVLYGPPRDILSGVLLALGLMALVAFSGIFWATRRHRWSEPSSRASTGTE